MPVVGSGNSDGVDAAVFEDPAQVRLQPRPPAGQRFELRRRLRHALFVGIAERSHFDAVDPGQGIHVIAAATAHADYGYADPVARRRPTAGNRKQGSGGPGAFQEVSSYDWRHSNMVGGGEAVLQQARTARKGRFNGLNLNFW